METIFRPYEDDIFDKNHMHFIENFTSSDQLFNYVSDKKYENKFSMQELEYALKSIKRKATGSNTATNSVLKDLDTNG